MNIREYPDVTIIDAGVNHFLALKGEENSEKIIGRPRRIMLENTGIIPEFEEREVEE